MTGWPTAVPFGVDFAHGATAAPAAGSDLSTRLLAFQSKRGRTYELDRVQAGTLALTLLNLDAALDPGNASSAYNTGGKSILPYRPCALSATYGGVTYPIFGGYVERWPLTPSSSAPTVTPQAVDAFTLLANRKMRPVYLEQILSEAEAWFMPLTDAAGNTTASLYTPAGTLSATPAQLVKSKSGGAQPNALGSTALVADMGTSWAVTAQTGYQGSGWVISTPGLNRTARIGGGLAVPSISVVGSLEVWLSPTVGGWALTQADALGNTEFAVAVDPTGVVYAQDGAGTTVTGTKNILDGKPHLAQLRVIGGHMSLYVDGVSAGSVATTQNVAASGSVSLGVIGPSSGWQSTLVLGRFGLAAVYPTSAAPTTHYALGAAPYDGETAYDRAARAVVYAGLSLTVGATAVPGMVDGDVLMPLSPSVGWSGKSALDVIYQAADSAGAVVYCDATGNLHVDSRAVRWITTTSAYTFGNGAGELPYEFGTGFDFDPTYVYNDIEIGRTNGVTQTIVNATSAALYGQRTFSATYDLQTDDQVADRAAWIAMAYANPMRRPTQVVLRPSTNAALWPACLSLDIGDRVTVKAHLPTSSADTISIDCFVEGVAHSVEVSSSTPSWVTTLTVSPAGPQVLISDNATFGLSDTAGLYAGF